MPAAPPLRHRPPQSALLRRCLLLAGLLHVWLVLVFGNATGAAAPGEGVWGRLSVRLIGPGGGAGNTAGEAVAEIANNGAPGQASQTREGGRVRRSEPPLAATGPGAAELGRWNPQEVPPEAASTEALSAAPPEIRTLRLPEGEPAAERPGPVDLALRRAAAPLALPERELPPPTARLSPSPTASLERLSRPTPLSQSSPPSPPSPAATPDLFAPLPPAQARLDAPPPRLPSALPRPDELRATAAPTPLPSAELPILRQRLEASTPSARVTALPQPSDLRASAQTPRMPTELTPAELPALTQRLQAVPSAEPLMPLSPATTARLPEAQSAAINELAGELPGAPTAATAATAAPAATPPGDAAVLPGSARASAGSPDAGSRLGHDVATPPSAAASAPRAPLNLSLPRGMAAARRGAGLLELLPQPPERKTRLAQEVEDAAKKDCRKSYAGAGILAALPLLLDAARDKGCKW